MSKPISVSIPCNVSLNDAVDYAKRKLEHHGWFVEPCDIAIHRINDQSWPFEAFSEYWVKLTKQPARYC
jgi:hypothetical protein